MISYPLWFRLASYCAHPLRRYLYKWSASEWHPYGLSGSTANNQPLGPCHGTYGRAVIWLVTIYPTIRGMLCVFTYPLLTPTPHLPSPTLTAAVINPSILVVLSCFWAGPSTDYNLWYRYCDTLAYDIVIQFFLVIWALTAAAATTTAATSGERLGLLHTK